MNRDVPHDGRIDRRSAIRRMAGGSLLALTTGAPSLLADPPPARTSLGMVQFNCSLRRRWMQERDPNVDLFDPSTFLHHCRGLGAGGMQASLGVLSPEQSRNLREQAESSGMFIEAIVRPPRDDGDLDRFDAEIRTAAEAGALAVRTVIIPGRRYEQFATLEEFRAAVEQGRRMLQRAAPIVAKHRVRLAVENHKDQRIDERVELLREFDGEFIGACVDTGNSVALLDDPDETIRALAPFAFSVHLKDQAVREYDDGFLLGDIPLGEGCFDLNRMVATLQQARPDVRFVLELITRDPLKVPCLSERYWATLPAVPGQDLARTLRMVRKHSAEHLQQVGSLSPKEQVALEDANLAASLKYARDVLKMSSP